MWQSQEILKVSDALNLKQIFWKTKTLLKKLEYPLLLQKTKTENATSPYKNAVPEANVQTNRMGGGGQNGPITKNRVLPVTTLFFWKLCFR